MATLTGASTSQGPRGGRGRGAPPSRLSDWSWAPGASRGPKPAKPPRGNPYVTGQGGPASWTGLTDAQILAQAQAAADAQLGSKSADIERIRAAAMAAARRDEAALQGLGTATSQIMAPIPGRIAAIGKQAGQAIAGYGQGYATQAQGEIQAGQTADAATVAQQTGGTDQGTPTIDPAAVHDSMYALGGDIPATAETQTETASANAAAGMPAVVMRAAQEDIQQRMAEAASTDAGYRQQLLDLYSTRPDLVQGAVDRLNSIEAQKFSEWKAQQDLAQNQQQIDIQNRAERANEQAVGVRGRQNAKALAQRQQTLNLQDNRYALDLKKYEQSGGKIDAAASKMLGYVVDNNGNPVLDSNGNKIKVQQSAKDNTTAAGQAALKLRGTPVAAPARNSNGLPSQGKYVARRGVPGVFPDGTTNDPARAQYSGGMTFAQAVSYLVTTYGISRAQARKILVSTGWKPGQ